MKYLLTLSLIALVGIMAACSSGDQSSDSSADAGQTSQQQFETQSNDAVAAARKAVAETEGRQLEEGSEITVVGTLGCGHCTYHVGENCSAAIQTMAGMVFILDVAEESEWFQNRFDGAELEVTGKVRHKGSDVLLETTAVTEL